MTNATYRVPVPTNEPILSYAPGTPEREALKAAAKDMGSKVIDIPMFIGGEEIRTGKLAAPPTTTSASSAATTWGLRSTPPTP